MVTRLILQGVSRYGAPHLKVGLDPSREVGGFH